MRPLSLFGRLGLAIATVNVAALAAGAPALAEPPTPDAPPASAAVEVGQDAIVKVASTAKTLKVTVTNPTDVAASNVSVTIDASDVASTVTVELPGVDEACTVTGKVAKCVLAELAGKAKHEYTVTLSPGGGSDTGEAGHVVTTATGENVAAASTSTAVQRVTPGVDLVVSPIADVPLDPGESAPVPVVVRNRGENTADGVLVTIGATAYLTLPTSLPNCDYDDELLELSCAFDDKLATGGTFEIDPGQVNVKLDKQAPGPATYGVQVRVAAASDADAELLKKAKAPGALRLRPVSKASASKAAAVEDSNEADNLAEFDVKASKNLADLAAVGAKITGAVGKTREVKVGVKNNGPADTLPPGEGSFVGAGVVLPSGVEATAVFETCVPFVDDKPILDEQGKVHGGTYFCIVPETLKVGETFLFPFSVKIVKAGDPGAIAVAGDAEDPNSGNNDAPIELKLTATGGGGGGTGGGLPVTGTPVALVAGAGAVLLALGAGAFVLTRRRRIVTIVD